MAHESSEPATALEVSPRRSRVVVVGAGFGGLATVRGLRDAPVDVVLVDRHNYHLFQPLLYQVATGGLSPANIATPIRALVARQANVRTVLGAVEDIELEAHEVALDSGERVAYDTLVLAAGGRYDYFGHPEWQAAAPSLKTLDDAVEIRARIFSAFEDAARTGDAEERRAHLSFVVVGGGPTGLELAGALAELARDTLEREFRELDAHELRIVLLEAADAILAGYAPSLQRSAVRALGRLGVTVRLRTLVTAVDDRGVEVREAGAPPDAPTERLSAATVLWAAGVRAVPLADRLRDRADLEVDRSGRLVVDESLALPAHPEVYAIGDLAHVRPPGEERPLPAIAPVAIQQGEHVARHLRARLEGRVTPPFRYRDRGKMATIGRGHAVAQVRFVRVSGVLGWLAWLWVHIWQLAGLQNRALVMTQWAWLYLTHNRAARLLFPSRPPTPEMPEGPRPLGTVSPHEATEPTPAPRG